MSPTPEARLARLGEQIDQLQRLVDMFGPVARQVLDAQHDADHAREKNVEQDQWIRDLEDRLTRRIDGIVTECKGIRDDYRADAKARAESRGKVILAVIAASATVLAATIAAIATIVGGG